ncbi:MAG: MerR family transcriptional regulator, partial [Planctomycetota bacterium]|nr:MerR family transcriptional regulator [Planctomycetota bacterium]
ERVGAPRYAVGLPDPPVGALRIRGPPKKEVADGSMAASSRLSLCPPSVFRYRKGQSVARAFPPDSSIPLPHMTVQPNPPDLLKIGKFAKLAKTNLRTLRYYEELGLVTPSRRSKGGFRYYRPTDLARVEMIQFLQELGLQLEEIGDSLRGIPKSNLRKEWMTRLRSILAQQESLIRKRIDALQSQVKLVEGSVTHLDLCETCEHHPQATNNYCEPCQSSGNPLPKLLSALF